MTTTFIKNEHRKVTTIADIKISGCFRMGEAVYMKSDERSYIRLDNNNDSQGYIAQLLETFEVEPISVEIREL